MKKIIVLIITWICIALVACWIDFSKDTQKNLEMSGLVIKKYADLSQHGSPTVICKMNQSEKKFRLTSWARRNSPFWDYLEVNDSIIKPIGTLTMRVKKGPDYITYKDFEYVEK